MWATVVAAAAAALPTYCLNSEDLLAHDYGYGIAAELARLLSSFFYMEILTN